MFTSKADVRAASHAQLRKRLGEYAKRPWDTDEVMWIADELEDRGYAAMMAEYRAYREMDEREQIKSAIISYGGY